MPTAMKHGLIHKTNVGYILTDKAQDIMKKNDEANVHNKKVDQSNIVQADTRARSPRLDKLRNTIGDAALHSLIQTTLRAAGDGSPLRDRTAIESAAKASGMTTQEVLQTFNSAWQASEIRAKAAMRKAGLNPENVVEHLWNKVEPRTRNSIVAGLIAGDPAALNHLVKLHQSGDKR
jgi:hypothetical protein